jgi:archaellum component FlaC
MTPDEFLHHWRLALNSKEDPLKKLRPMLNAGTLGEITGEYVLQLADSLQPYPGLAERIALTLALRDRFGNLNSLSSKCLNRLRDGFATALAFSSNDFTGYRAAKDIPIWINEHLPATGDNDRDIWLRRFVVCVLKDTDSRVLVAALVAAGHACGPRTSQHRVQRNAPEHSFVRGIVQALASPKITVGRVDLTLSGIEAVNAQLEDVQNRELNLQRQIRTQKDQIDDCQNRISQLEDDLAQVRDQNNHQSAQIATLTKSLSDADERYLLLDQHWKGVSEQELAKQSGGFREKVGQELKEAIIALDRDTPNVEMALRRLKRVEDILSR